MTDLSQVNFKTSLNMSFFISYVCQCYCRNTPRAVDTVFFTNPVFEIVTQGSRLVKNNNLIKVHKIVVLDHREKFH